MPTFVGRGFIMIVTALLALALQQEANFTPPDWVQRPQPQYPDFAAFIRVDSRVTLRCVAEVDGTMDQCEVVAASPDGLGFEQLALESMAGARMRPAVLDGEPVARRTQFRINFRMADYADRMPKRTPYRGPEPSARAKELAEIIAAQMGEIPMEASITPVGGLALDRIETVTPWLREALPFRRMTVAFLSRYLDEADLERIRMGEPPLAPEPTITDMKTLLSDFVPEDDPTTGVRGRYCAIYACEISDAPAPPAATTPTP
ncbi:hypothetical protein ASG17_04390 [Brevundimonas sp. Leaf363]|nr:hypothetical protein ASG17_04390 [Brevundimonas sp. Leaf363]